MTALALEPAPPREAARYQAQDSDQTLAEALEEYYRRNGGRVLRPADLAPESAALFASHDVCHVIFGLDTTLADEAMADTRTLLSCDVGWRRYSRYLTADPQAKTIFADLGYGRAVWITVRAAPRLLAAVIEALKMRKPWPWRPPAEFRQRTLADLRREFGIRVI